MKRQESEYLGVTSGEEAVLLLHSFTSNANEMRQLAVSLHAKGLLDNPDFHQSIDLMEQSVSSPFILKKDYAQSGHFITLGKQREQLQENIFAFLEMVKARV